MPSISEISTKMTKANAKKNVLLHIYEAEARTPATPEAKAKILDDLKVWLKESSDEDEKI